MSHHEVGPEQDVAPALERVVAELRTPVPVRAEWRADLVRTITSELAPSTRVPNRWRLRPMTAIAAGLICMLTGAGVTAIVLGRGRVAPNEQLTNLTATMPLPGETTDGPTVRFVFVAPYASRVALVGDFNGWNPSAMPMRRSPDGRAWMIDVPLAPGRHVYSFMVDGDVTPDPAAPRAGEDDFGVPSSVVLVADRGPKI